MINVIFIICALIYLSGIYPTFLTLRIGHWRYIWRNGPAPLHEFIRQVTNDLIAAFLWPKTVWGWIHDRSR